MKRISFIILLLATTYCFGQNTSYFPSGSTNAFVAYVDTLGNDNSGQLNNPMRPFLTINAAVGALPSAGGVVYIGWGSFTSPDSAHVKSNIWYKGSKRPVPNLAVTVVGTLSYTTTSPTRLVNGTVLRGTFPIPYNRNNISVTDLGVDVGSDWVTNVNGSISADGIASYPKNYSTDTSQLREPPIIGLNFSNLTVLQSSSIVSNHGMVLQNAYHPHADNIYLYWGFAGLVCKTIGGVFTNIHAFGCGTSGIYLKSNYYSYGEGQVINGFEIGSIGSYDGAGVLIDGNDNTGGTTPGPNSDVVSNGVVMNAQYGVKTSGIVHNLKVSNVSVHASSGAGFTLATGLRYSTFTNCSADHGTTYGFDASGLSTTDTLNSLTACSAFSNGNSGFKINSIYVDNISSNYNTGYGIFSNGTNVNIGVILSTIGNTTAAITGAYTSLIPIPLTNTQIGYGVSSVLSSTPDLLFDHATAHQSIGDGSSATAPGLLVNYPIATGSSAFTGEAAGTPQFGFSINNQGLYGGTTGTTGGRCFDLYDYIGAALRLGVGPTGTYYVGPSSTNYNLAVAQPSGGGANVTIAASGKTTFVATTTAASSLNIPSGTAPTSPATGDIYYDGTHLYFKPSGTAVDLISSAGIDNVLAVGQALTANRTINAQNFLLKVTGNSGTLLYANDTLSAGGNTALRGESIGGTGVMGLSNSSVPVLAENSSTSTNTVVTGILVTRQGNSFNGASGEGIKIDFSQHDDAGSIVTTGNITSKVTTASTGAVVSGFDFTTNNAGTLIVPVSISGNGTLTTTSAKVDNIVTTAAGTYTILATDFTVVATGTTSTWTFPTAVTGRRLNLVNHGSGAVTLGTAVTTANATTTTTLAAGSNYDIQYDGTVWRKIN